MTIVVFVWFNLVYFLRSKLYYGMSNTGYLEEVLIFFLSPEAVKAFFFPEISFSGFHDDLSPFRKTSS